MLSWKKTQFYKRAKEQEKIKLMENKLCKRLLKTISEKILLLHFFLYCYEFKDSFMYVFWGGYEVSL